MAITDGLKAQIYPVAGETAIKNIVDNSSLSGTGTPSLIDEGLEKAWSIVTGTLLEGAVPPKTPAGAVTGSGVTIAVRFKATSNGSGTEFLSMFGIKPAPSSVDTGVRFTREGNGKYRGRIDNQLNVALSGFALNTVYTLVYKLQLNSGSAQDFGKLWMNTVGRVGVDANAVTIGSDCTINRTFDRLFINSQGGFAYTLLDFAYWDRELSDAECASVADGYRLVMPSPGTPVITPITFSGTIPNQTFSAGQSTSVNLATYFSGTETPFTFSNTGASSTSVGLSVSSSGVLSGTASEGSAIGVVVTGTDIATNTASSNAFNITVTAAGTPVSFSGTVPTISGTQSTAITPVNLSTYFSGSLTPFTYNIQVGSLLSGLSLNTSTGVISGTPTTSGTTNIAVRATDSGSNTANTNTFTINIATAPSADGLITLSELKNNTATPLTSLSGFNVTLLTATNPKSVVYNSGNISTNSSAALTFSNAAINAGTEYVYLVDRNGTAFAAGKVTAT